MMTFLKKIILFSAFYLLFTLISCNSAVYTSDYDVKKQGVNFREGNWLLAKIDCQSEYESELRIEANNYFSTILKDRYNGLSNSKTPLLSKKIDLNPNEETLKKLKKETLFDYVINVKAEKLKEGTDSDFTLSSKKHPVSNKVKVALEVYDLNNSKIAYSRSFFGYSESGSTKKTTIQLIKNNAKLLHGCLKKITKDLDKKSLK